MATPVLNNWRHIGGDEMKLGILVGEVSRHPEIPDGWMTTSALAEIGEDCTWARTASRHYILGTPLPDDELLPAGAMDAVLIRLFRNAGTLPDEEALRRLLAYAEKLSEAPVKRTLDN